MIMRTSLLLAAFVSTVGLASAQENPAGPETMLAFGIGISTAEPDVLRYQYSLNHRSGHFFANIRLQSQSDDAIRGVNNIGEIDVRTASASIGLTTKPLEHVTAGISAGV